MRAGGEAGQKEGKMAKSLVAYFTASGAGVTKGVATRLADAIGADLFEIIPDIPYSPADLDWKDKTSRTTIEMNDPASRPVIASKVADMAAYDKVFVGFPVWWYTCPRIIDTFLESYNFEGKTIIPFATSGSSDIGKSGEDMQAVVKGAKVLEGKRFAAGVSADELKAWAESL